MSYGAIIVAAGRGVRVGGDIPKQYLPLQGTPVLAHTVKKFAWIDIFREIVIVIPTNYLDYTREKIWLPQFSQAHIKLVEGALQRQESVYRGLKSLDEKCQLVCVHDGVRPLVSRREIIETVKAGEENHAATLVAPLKDTLKEVDHDKNVLNTLPRENYRLTLTPQCFSRNVLEIAHEYAREEGIIATDDASLVEATGNIVKTVEGSHYNLKITTSEDLALAEILMEMRENNVSRRNGL